MVRGKAWTKLNKGTYTERDAVFNTGCTHPVTTKTVTDGMKKKIEPLDEILLIVQASGETL